jgi:hypothetical protein
LATTMVVLGAPIEAIPKALGMTTDAFSAKTGRHSATFFGGCARKFPRYPTPPQPRPQPDEPRTRQSREVRATSCFGAPRQSNNGDDARPAFVCRLIGGLPGPVELRQSTRLSQRCISAAAQLGRSGARSLKPSSPGGACSQAAFRPQKRRWSLWTGRFRLPIPSPSSAVNSAFAF